MDNTEDAFKGSVVGTGPSSRVHTLRKCPAELDIFPRPLNPTPDYRIRLIVFGTFT